MTPIEDLERLSREAAEKILKSEGVRIITHNDADGLSAGALLAFSLTKVGIPFHLTVIPRLTKQVVIDKGDYELLVFCDMGSTFSDKDYEEMGVNPENVIVLDHHLPTTTHSTFFMVNPHLVGVDGAFELCASGVVYHVVKNMVEGDVLLELAVSGMIGDKQAFKGPNRKIIEEGVLKEVFELKMGLILPERPLKEIFESAIEPYLPDALDVLEKMGITDKKPSELSELGLERKVANVIALVAIKNPNPRAVSYVIGEVVKSRGRDPYLLSSILDATGKMEKPSVGIGLAMGDDSCLEEGLRILRSYERKVKEGLERVLDAMDEEMFLRYAIVENLNFTGAVAGVITRYCLPPDKPFFILSVRDDEVRVSARGNSYLVSKGLNLSEVCGIASELGGIGGGHSVAAGATLPKGMEHEFIKRANKLVGEQMR
jgi:single-stranded DNA-specific DHH superfamily exonuclease